MKNLLAAAATVTVILIAGTAFAAQKTVKLAVENMYCASCPYIVKMSLADVPGVSAVEVSFEEKTATVTFDDAETNVESLTDATFNAGYPSDLVQPSQ